MRVGMLTGGGDCPGLNAVIRAIVRKGSFHYEDEFTGFLEGWRGLLDDLTMPLDLSSVGGILPRGGTILRTSRTNPSKHAEGIQKCAEALTRSSTLGPHGGSPVTLAVAALISSQSNGELLRRPFDYLAGSHCARPAAFLGGRRSSYLLTTAPAAL